MHDPLPAERPALRITHTREHGTYIRGTVNGDGVLAIVRHHGFMFFRSTDEIGIRRSGGRTAKLGKIESAAAALRAAGFTVDVDVSPDDAVRIVHSREHGTRLLGAVPGDGVWNVVRDHGFFASRHTGIFVRHSKWAPADHQLIADAAQTLRDAGYAVTVTIEGTEPQ
ncbi:hypothetical protein AB0F88_17165 [Streptosporangium sp. NPDC023963]|uniref:hypothetical protein n=1 Tax=Streptosporangium sp. NPDC023963 TaxID=3155608 RepID=UPI003441CB51